MEGKSSKSKIEHNISQVLQRSTMNRPNCYNVISDRPLLCYALSYTIKLKVRTCVAYIGRTGAVVGRLEWPGPRIGVT